MVVFSILCLATVSEHDHCAQNTDSNSTSHQTSFRVMLQKLISQVMNLIGQDILCSPRAVTNTQMHHFERGFGIKIYAS